MTIEKANTVAEVQPALGRAITAAVRAHGCVPFGEIRFGLDMPFEVAEWLHSEMNRVLREDPTAGGIYYSGIGMMLMLNRGGGIPAPTTWPARPEDLDVSVALEGSGPRRVVAVTLRERKQEEVGNAR